MTEQKKIIAGAENAVKAGAWYTVSSIMLRAIALITTPIFTRLMSKADYGVTNTFTAWASIFTIFCTLNLGYSIGRAKQDFPGKLDQYIGAMESLSLIFTMTIGVVAIAFIKPVSQWLQLSEWLVVLLVIYVLTHPVITMNQSRFRFQYRYKENVAISVYSSIVTIILSLLLIQYILPKEKGLAKILGMVIPCVLLALFLLLLQLKRKDLNCNKEYWKYGLIISLPLIIHTLSLNILTQSDRLVIGRFWGQEKVGIYSIAYVYAMMINIVLDSINQAWNPWFHDNYFVGNYAEIKKNVKPLVVLGVMLGIGCIAIAPEAIWVLGGDKYMEGIWIVPAVTLGVVCQYVYSQYVIIEMHLKKTIYVSIGTVIAAILNVSLNYIFVPIYGYIAAGYTTLASYLVLFILHYIITRYVLKVKLYHDSFMFGAILVTAVFAAIMMMLYAHTPAVIAIRYVLLSLLCFLWVFFNRRLILDFVRNKLRKRSIGEK